MECKAKEYREGESDDAGGKDNASQLQRERILATKMRIPWKFERTAGRLGWEMGARRRDRRGKAMVENTRVVVWISAIIG